MYLGRDSSSQRRFSMQLADLLRKCVRSESSITAVARATGVSQSTLQEFALGKTNGNFADLRLSSAQKLLDHYGLKITLPKAIIKSERKKMLLKDELVTYGVSDSPAEFRDRLIAGLVEWYPGRSIDGLVCIPKDSDAYCHRIRDQMDCQDLPLVVILKTLMNRRRSKKCPTGLARKGSKIHLASALREFDCLASPSGFRALVSDCLADMYKSRTIDEILCYPKQSKELCDYVRSSIACEKLPDELILTTLMNNRKSVYA